MTLLTRSFLLICLSFFMGLLAEMTLGINPMKKIQSWWIMIDILRILSWSFRITNKKYKLQGSHWQILNKFEKKICVNF